jgi:hypothetical protein
LKDLIDALVASSCLRFVEEIGRYVTSSLKDLTDALVASSCLRFVEEIGRYVTSDLIGL